MKEKGIGTILIDFIEEYARDRGSTQLSLDNSIKNRRARKLYEKRGMTVNSKSPNPLFMPGARLVRMIKTL
jgi:GNAT superfamily N-acetyltransferase